jgi:hypothetical protein
VNSPPAQTELVMLQLTEADMPRLRQELESTSNPLAGALSRCRVASCLYCGRLGVGKEAIERDRGSLARSCLTEQKPTRMMVSEH